MTVPGSLPRIWVYIRVPSQWNLQCDCRLWCVRQMVAPHPGAWIIEASHLFTHLVYTAIMNEKDPSLVEQSYTYATNKKYPEGCSDNLKRVIRIKSKKFAVRGGELCYYKNKGKVSHSCN